MLSLPPPDYKKDGTSGILDIARTVQLRIKHWAYAYRLTNDPKWKDRIWKEIVHTAGNSTGASFGTQGDSWNTDHWLDVGEFLVAFGIAYDWLYDAWTAEEREGIRWSVVDLGLRKGLESFEREEWFLGVTGNWNCVTAGGMIVGALAVLGDDTSGVARSLLGRAVENAEQHCGKSVDESGTWAETPDYWHFGTQAHAQLSSGLLTSLGSTFGMLDSHPKFRETGMFHIHNMGMTEKFNYGDCGPSKITATANSLFFYGREYGIPEYGLFQRDRPDAADPLSMLWYDSSLKGEWHDHLPLDKAFSDPRGAWVSLRSSWTDSNGVFVDIIQDTVRATFNIDYPAHQFRVIVSDDGRNQKLEAWVLQLAADTPNLYYTARVKYGPAGYKAGNLNHAITVSDTLPGGRAELVAGLDADMIPKKRWLRACVAHLIRDPKMGVVCPAQLFYNVPDNDPLNQQSSINWLCMDIIRDHAGLGWNLGSGWVVRREAVDDIGGFPTDCLVEDIYSSMLQMAEGWRSAYLAESLQYGLVPETYAAHVKQFARWYIGGAQMFVNFKGYLSSKLTKRMTLAAKLVGFSSGINVHAKAQLATVFMLLTPFVFLTGTHLMYWRDEAEMKLLLRLYCAIVLTRYLHDCHIGVMAGYRVAIMETGMMRYMSHYYTVAWFKTFFLGKPDGFTPTGSIANSLQERNPARRAPFRERLRHILFDCGVWVQLSVVLAFASCASLQAFRVLGPHWMSGNWVFNRDMWIELLKTVAWPSHLWFPTMLGYLTPLRYALRPPSVPERDRLLGKREENGARYPTEEAKHVRWSLFEVDFVVLYTLFMGYVAAVFVGSWWL